MPNHLQCADGIVILLGALLHTTHTHKHIPFQFAQSKRKPHFHVIFQPNRKNAMNEEKNKRREIKRAHFRNVISCAEQVWARICVCMHTYEFV